MRTPSWISISARRRSIVQLGRLATGASNNGVNTRKAASLFTGGGPGATLTSSASAPLLAKSLRHRRTESSLTPNASAFVGLVHPASVSSTARAKIRLASIARTRKSHQLATLFVRRPDRGLA
jgi:hypothetical protein